MPAWSWVLSINDVVCGLALAWLGWRSLTPNRPISLWIACGIGVWLNFAPLVFWAPKAVIYLNETLVGTLVIALTVLIPGMPNMVADVDHLAGALVVVASVVAFGEPVRAIRWLNVLLGLLIAGTPFIASGATTAGWINDAVVGLAVIALSLRRGPVKESFGSWNRWIK